MHIIIENKNNCTKINLTSLKKKSLRRIKDVAMVILYITSISLSGFIIAFAMDFLYRVL